MLQRAGNIRHRCLIIATCVQYWTLVVNTRHPQRNTTHCTGATDPCQSDVPDRHPGPAFGYVLEAEFEWAIYDQPAKVLKVGEAFYEPTGSLHWVTKNPAAKGKTRVMAAILRPQDAKQVTIPEPEK